MSMIKVKVCDLNEISSIVSKIKFNKIESKEIRKVLLKFASELSKSAKDLQKELDVNKSEIFKEFSQDDLNVFQNAVNEIAELLKDLKTEEAVKKDKEITDKYPDITAAYNKFSNFFLELQNRIEEYDIDQIDVNLFIESMSNQDLDITTKELSLLNPLFYNEV